MRGRIENRGGKQNTIQEGKEGGEIADSKVIVS